MKTISKLSIVLLAVTVLFSCKKKEVTPDSSATTTHAIGEAYEGAVVFSVDAYDQNSLVAATVVQRHHINWSTANANCNTYAAGTERGWRLPTKDELGLMKVKKSIIGGFKNMDYWSSTKAASGTSAWALYFGTTTGGIIMSNGKQLSNYTICARVVKAF